MTKNLHLTLPGRIIYQKTSKNKKRKEIAYEKN